MDILRLRQSARMAVVAALATLLIVAPITVLAHAELDVATPADGATVEGSPPEVSGTYTHDMDVDGSSMQLRDADGTVIAKGGVDPDDARRMAIEDLPVLAPGEYEVRWTSLSSEDDELARGTWTFTVSADPGPSPTPPPTPTPTPPASAAATTAPTTSPTEAASAAISASPSSEPSPTASAVPGDASTGGSDVLLPILAALAIVAVVGVILVSRRGRAAPPA